MDSETAQRLGFSINQMHKNQDDSNRLVKTGEIVKARTLERPAERAGGEMMGRGKKDDPAMRALSWTEEGREREPKPAEEKNVASDSGPTVFVLWCAPVG